MPIALEGLTKCINDVDEWLGQNRLKLNQVKTQFIIMGSWQQLRLVKPTAVNVCGVDIRFSDCVSNLGFVFDSRLSMWPHIRLLTGKCSFLSNQLRKSLDMEIINLLVHAFFNSRLDYCNSLLYGVAKKYLSRLQILQNQAAGLIFVKRKFDHASPLLMELHWLPVQKRILV